MRIELKIEERHCGPYASGFSCPIARALVEIVRPSISVRVEYWSVRFIVPELKETLVLNLGEEIGKQARIFDSLSARGTLHILPMYLPVTLHLELPEELVFGHNLLDMKEK